MRNRSSDSLRGMRVLFALPPFAKEHKIVPPLGLGYLASVLRESGATCNLIDSVRDGITVDQIVARAKTFDPQLVGIPILTAVYPQARELVNAFRTSGYSVVVGGPHASALPEATIKDLGADYLIFGEGEHTLLELCELLYNSSQPDLSGIRGLVFFDKGAKIVRTGPRELIENIDDIPFPAWDLFPPSEYPPAPIGTFFKRYPIANVITSRGCPFDCTFCSTNVTWMRRFRSRSVENISDELELLVKKFSVREIHFVDDNIATDRTRMVRLCREIVGRNLDIVWSCVNGLRIDSLDRELLKEMARAGCYSLSFGIESGNNAVLRNIRKRIDLEQIERIVKMAREEHIETRGFFIMGLPGDNEQTIRQTIDFSKRLPLDFAGYSILVPMPGSEIFDSWSLQNSTESEDIDWAYFNTYSSKVSICGISDKRLKKFCFRANREFYLRPKQIIKLMGHASHAKWMFKRLFHYA